MEENNIINLPKDITPLIMQGDSFTGAEQHIKLLWKRGFSMEKLKINKLKDNVNEQTYEVNYQLSVKELFNKLQIDKNDGSNDIISAVSEKIKKHLPKNSRNLTDTWEITNNKDLINFKFLLELKGD